VTSSDLAARGAADTTPRSALLLLCLLTFAWGLNWPAIKIALGEIPVWTYRSYSVGGGALGLFAMALLTRQRIRLRRAEVAPLLVCTLFNVVGWHLLSAYAVAMIEAGRSAIIGYTMPLWAAIFGPWLLRERLRRETIWGLAVGSAGLGLLLLDDFAAFGRSPVGTLIMVGAAMSWALGTVLTKRLPADLPTVTMAAWQLGIGACVIMLGALAIDGPPRFDAISDRAWYWLLYSTVFPMLLGHWLWFKLVRLLPAVVAAVSTLAVPVVGFLSSAILLGEPLGLREILALLLVLTALMVVLVLPSLRRRRPPPPALPEP